MGNESAKFKPQPVEIRETSPASDKNGEINYNSIMNLNNTSYVEWFEQQKEYWMPWPEPVFYKLFLDPEGRNASISATRVEIWSRNFFSEEVFSIFRGKYIGGKTDKPGNMFLFDIMKSGWEDAALESGNSEINFDIVMSHAPLMRTCITLYSYVELQQRYLEYKGFQGSINVTMRFAHPSSWDVHNYEAKAALIGAMQRLEGVGISIYVMDTVEIMDEVKNDGLYKVERSRKFRSAMDKRSKWIGDGKKPNRPMTKYRHLKERNHDDRVQRFGSQMSLGSQFEESFSPETPKIRKTLRGTDNYAEWVNAKFEDLLYGDNDSIKENVSYCH